jgi:hypothetical protein
VDGEGEGDTAVEVERKRGNAAVEAERKRIMEGGRRARR